MRIFSTTTLALLFISFLTSTAEAKWPKLRIVRDSVRFGLPPGRTANERDETGAATYVCKTNMWAPIYFDIEVLDQFDNNELSNCYLQVETQDGDAYTTKYVLPMMNFASTKPGEIIKSIECRWMPYFRTGDNYGGSILMSIKNQKGDDVCEVYRSEFVRQIDPSQYVVLSLGSKLASFDVKNANAEGNMNQPNRSSRVSTSSILEISQMPDQWIGYDICDVIIIGTGSSADFATRLFGEDGEKNPAIRARRDALIEWVRRGGKLIISVGTNANTLTQYKNFQELLPLPINNADPKADYPSITLTGPQSSMGKEGTLKPKDGTIPVANFRIVKDRAFRTVMSTNYLNNEVAKTVPLIVQSNFGMGRISVVGFDLDRSPFTDFIDRANVWNWLLKECGSPKAAAGKDKVENSVSPSFNQYGGGLNQEDDLAAAVQRDLDRFEGVPVISFGWVALFVLLYTLVIGPLEYIILKKVFKKLEWTWITFPLIVLGVSLASYLAAYSIKGSDLKLNKFDVIDIDVQNNKLYGKTWVSIFSPRQESFNFSVTPNEGWSPANNNLSQVAEWVHGGRNSGRQSIFRSNYKYGLDLNPDAPQFASHLDSVPIKVWSVKSLQSNWSCDANQNLIESKLFHPPGDEKALSGTLTHRLPCSRLTDVHMIYMGRVYELGDIEANSEIRPQLDEKKEKRFWFVESANLDQLSYVLTGDDTNARWRNQVGPTDPGQLSYWGFLFHEAALKPTLPLNNSTMRRLDQSWRVANWNVNEVILVAKLPIEKDAIDNVLKPNSTSPTQLWLKGKSEAGKERPPISGKIRQETYIRIIVPVKPANK